MEADFFAAAAHWLRGPLNVITGWAGVLRTGQASPAVVVQAAEALDRSCRRQVDLLDNVLELWALSERARAIEPGPVPIRQPLQAAIESARPIGRAHGVAIEVEAGPSPVALGDAATLTRALDILLRHGIGRSPEGSAVRVRAGASGDRAQIEVVDAGPALPPEATATLFDRYRPPEPQGASAHGSLNLELAIARHLAVLHRGDLSAQSGPDRGLTITLSLPSA